MNGILIHEEDGRWTVRGMNGSCCHAVRSSRQEAEARAAELGITIVNFVDLTPIDTPYPLCIMGADNNDTQRRTTP